MIFLIGNKADLESTREVTYEEAKQFADENGLMFVETSAMRWVLVLEFFPQTHKKINSNKLVGKMSRRLS